MSVSLLPWPSKKHFLVYPLSHLCIKIWQNISCKHSCLTQCVPSPRSVLLLPNRSSCQPSTIFDGFKDDLRTHLSCEFAPPHLTLACGVCFPRERVCIGLSIASVHRMSQNEQCAGSSSRPQVSLHMPRFPLLLITIATSRLPLKQAHVKVVVNVRSEAKAI